MEASSSQRVESGATDRLAIALNFGTHPENVSGDHYACPMSDATSLYRRFRPGRFSELRGQDHIVRALQGAVSSGKVHHAYLFSGPRGTGKTTTARILAKALNCERPNEGDACNECASCVAITQGRSLDVIELDSASNNGVDAIRDLTANAWQTSPGHWKVYILDEVHQLSKSASAALLKTLEEPPSHVVFVLATTDPHKVIPTIRSRTQHLEFRLLNGETLNELLEEVQRAAGLGVEDGTIAAAVRLGKGSARDALSALDQLVATGEATGSDPVFEELFQALASSSPGDAIRALAKLQHDGWDPEQLAESFAAQIRQTFLLLVAPEVASAVNDEATRLSAWGQQLGLAKTVRILETVGRSMREMKSAPDKIAMLEVAMVRLTRPDLDNDVAALAERVAKLERGGVAAPAPIETPAPTLNKIGSTPAAPAPQPKPAPPSRPIGQAPVKESAPEPESPIAETATKVTGAAVTLEDIQSRFESKVMTALPKGSQLFLRTTRLVAFAAGVLTISVDNASLLKNSELVAPGLRKALEHEFKTGFQLNWVVGDAPAPVVETPAPVQSAPEEDEEIIDESEVVASVEIDSGAEHLITSIFPNAKEI